MQRDRRGDRDVMTLKKKNRSGPPRKPGGRQGSYWTSEKDERYIARAVKKAGRRMAAQAPSSVELTRSKWKHDALMAAAKVELARE